MRRSSEETREHVLQVTRDLFYWDGIRATGVDKIARTADVAPTTLYRLFASKDDLVAAYLEREARQYRAWFAAAIADESAGARGQILGLFDALTEQVDSAECRGCPFQMSLAELADPSLPGRQHAVAVKVWTRDQLRALTEKLAASSVSPDAPALADQLLVIMEGVYAAAQSINDVAGLARNARALVGKITDPGRGRQDSEPAPRR